MIKSTLFATLVFLASVASAEPPAFDAELAAIQDAWATANYRSADESSRQKALETLSHRSHAFAAAYPERAEALIWEGIVLSTYAGAKGGLGALGLAKQSRAVLERAIALDPNALEGSAYTSLGALYAKVPHFPVGFGDDKKARECFLKALAINPNGIDQNYFYADFLIEQGKYAEANDFLDRALHASARPGREVADAGRRQEILALQARVRSKKG